jgi:hypothetical protein
MRLHHTVWGRYGDVVSRGGDWVTVRFDGDKGVNCYEVDAPYIKLIKQDRGGIGETLVTNYDEVQELKAQLAELRKDKERLDWLLNRAYTIQLREGDIFTSREDIDREME